MCGRLKRVFGRIPPAAAPELTAHTVTVTVTFVKAGGSGKTLYLLPGEMPPPDHDGPVAYVATTVGATVSGQAAVYENGLVKRQAE